MGYNGTPEEQCQERWRHHNTLDKEQKTKFLDRHQSENGLEDPVEELRKHRQEIVFGLDFHKLTKQRRPADVIPALSGR